MLSARVCPPYGMTAERFNSRRSFPRICARRESLLSRMCSLRGVGLRALHPRAGRGRAVRRPGHRYLSAMRLCLPKSVYWGCLRCWSKTRIRETEEHDRAAAGQVAARVRLEAHDFSLEIGCGKGWFAEELATKFPRANAVLLQARIDLAAEAKQRNLRASLLPSILSEAQLPKNAFTSDRRARCRSSLRQSSARSGDDSESDA